MKKLILLMISGILTAGCNIGMTPNTAPADPFLNPNGVQIRSTGEGQFEVKLLPELAPASVKRITIEGYQGAEVVIGGAVDWDVRTLVLNLGAPPGKKVERFELNALPPGPGMGANPLIVKGSF